MANINKGNIIIHVLMILICSVIGVFIPKYSPDFILILLVLFSIIFLTFRWPEIGTLVVVFLVYSNIIVISVHFYSIPKIIASSFILILFIPISYYIIIQGEKLIIDRIFLTMLVFLVVLLTSSFFAKDVDVAMDWIVVFFQEGLVIYLLVINAIRRLVTLKRVIWVLILAGSLLGTMSLYQALTQSYDKQFGGLAQRSDERIKEWKKEKFEYTYGQSSLGVTRPEVGERKRAGGPMEGPNRYAQIMLVLLPLAFFRFREEHLRLPRLGAVVATSLILCGVLLSYSRGAFLTLVLLVLLVTCMRYVRPYQILVSVSVLLLLMVVIAPGYFARVNTIRGVKGLFSDEAEVEPDGATRGRMTEMLAALMVFLDHPLLGVGPGQYSPFYSKEYHLNPDIAFRHLPNTRRAHSLYFELAAETGLLGVTTFMTIVLLAMVGLWRTRRRWLHSRPDLATLATALFLSLVAYLGTAMFLHFSYQRYYWLLLAVVGATLQIFRSEIPPADEQEETDIATPNALHDTAMRLF